MDHCPAALAAAAFSMEGIKNANVLPAVKILRSDFYVWRQSKMQTFCLQSKFSEVRSMFGENQKLSRFACSGMSQMYSSRLE